MNRRGFLTLVSAGVAAAADPERLLWVPGRKLISIPSPRVFEADLLDLRELKERYFDRNGRPMTLLELAYKLEDLPYRRVQETHYGPIRVSTVWLGADHALFKGQSPLIFETMIFGGPESIDGYQNRYTTEAQARMGHEAACKLVRQTILPLSVLDQIKQLIAS